MYRIIGGDGREYGPVSAEQIRQWVRENRANADTRACVEGTNEWKPLRAFPEFADLWPLGMPAGLSGGVAGALEMSGSARARVSGPAIGLLITAALGGVMSLAMMLAAGKTIVPARGEVPPELAPFAESLSPAACLTTGLIGLVLSALVAYGARQMQTLRSFGWSVTAAVLALIPCTSPCCVLGVPIGIWALVVLYRPEVRAAFGSQAGVV